MAVPYASERLVSIHLSVLMKKKIRCLSNIDEVKRRKLSFIHDSMVTQKVFSNFIITPKNAEAFKIFQYSYVFMFADI